MTERDLGVDPVGVAFVAVFALLVAPGAVFGSVYLLTDGFALGSLSAFELVAAGLSTPIGVLMMWVGVRELLGAVRVRFEDGQVVCGATAIPWSAITELEAPEFGVLDIIGGSKGERIRLRTYLFRNRRQLLEYIAEKSGIPAPEMSVSL